MNVMRKAVRSWIWGSPASDSGDWRTFRWRSLGRWRRASPLMSSSAPMKRPKESNC